MKARYLFVAVLLASVAVYFGSPYWAVYRLKQAVELGPPSELTRRIDFDAVREATKTELARATDERLKGNSRSSRAVTAGLGHMLAVAMVSSKVDEFVTPDSVATLIERSTRDHGYSGVAAVNQLRTFVRSVISGRFEGANSFKLLVPDTSGEQQKISLVFSRLGWYEWRLSSIQFPSTGASSPLAAIPDSVS